MVPENRNALHLQHRGIRALAEALCEQLRHKTVRAVPDRPPRGTVGPECSRRVTRVCSS